MPWSKSGRVEILKGRWGKAKLIVGWKQFLMWTFDQGEVWWVKTVREGLQREEIQSLGK